jgi:hypothetical protein
LTCAAAAVLSSGLPAALDFGAALDLGALLGERGGGEEGAGVARAPGTVVAGAAGARAGALGAA